MTSENATRIETDERDSWTLLVAGEGLFATHPLPDTGEVAIGRAADVEVVVPHDSVSRRHALLRLGNAITVEDLDSSNGTSVNDKRLAPSQPMRIAPGDVIRLGRVVVIVRGPVESRQPGKGASAPRVVVQSPAMRSVYKLIDSVAPGNINVLLSGETGVGKEVIARELHARSPRGQKPFVGLNCATFSETLLESELFGHEKGAFTGADASKLGIFETARGGTVFLDEIGELPVTIQAKLLRVLEERQVHPVGSLKPHPIDVRFVTATNRNLDAEIKAGRFRKDLYFRLNGITVTIPPLRERLDEIKRIADEFIVSFSAQLGSGRAPPVLGKAALDEMLRYPWPGNVRELRNVIERAVLLCGSGPIEPHHLQLTVATAPPAPAAPAAASPANDTIHDAEDSSDSPLPISPAKLRDELQLIEKERILAALASCGGNQTRAAKLLGISRRTLCTKLEQYGVPRPRAGSDS